MLLRPRWVDKELAWGGDEGPPDSLIVRETPLLLLKSPDRRITEACSLGLGVSQHGSAEIKSPGDFFSSCLFNVVASAGF